MSKLGNDFFNSPKTGIKNTDHIIGLESFIKGLEKNFFADVSIGNYSLKKDSANLTIDIKCNLTLDEALFHLNKVTPDHDCTCKFDLKKTFRFLLAYSELKKLNIIPVDISELTISLNDTTILISKIYEQSIADQAENIFTELIKHNLYYTKGRNETPFEIFIPVFEEDTLESDAKLKNIVSDNNNTNDYFGFWGMYYDQSEEAAIYDLNTKTIIHGDIQILSE
jgi:CRISPR/Cas system CSM-associated protein Csm2 small subunit